MIQVQRILCPIDFSDTSLRAFDHAVAIAGWYGSTITLFHVYALAAPALYPPGYPIVTPELFTPAAHDDLRAAMERLKEHAARSRVPIEIEVVQGTPTRDILRRAQEMPSDLIVMGTHGLSGFDRWVLGSVTEKVLRKASCPVLSVPPKDDAATVHAPFKHIVCALDFSECSRRAFDYAVSLAEEADAHLAIVHVMDLPPEMARTQPKWLESIKADRRRCLEQAVPAAAREYCTVETSLRLGKPYQEILQFAREQASDLIVIGIHGRGAEDLLFFGSTTQHVVRHATCPVLTLRTG